MCPNVACATDNLCHVVWCSSNCVIVFLYPNRCYRYTISNRMRETERGRDGCCYWSDSQLIQIFSFLIQSDLSPIVFSSRAVNISSSLIFFSKKRWLTVMTDSLRGVFDRTSGLAWCSCVYVVQWTCALYPYISVFAAHLCSQWVKPFTSKINGF